MAKQKTKSAKPLGKAKTQPITPSKAQAKPAAKTKKPTKTSRVVGALKAGAKQVVKRKVSAQKKVDDILLKLGPSLQATLGKIQDHIDSGVSKVEDVKKVGLQILQNAQKISSSLKKKKKN